MKFGKKANVFKYCDELWTTSTTTVDLNAKTESAKIEKSSDSSRCTVTICSPSVMVRQAWGVVTKQRSARSTRAPHSPTTTTTTPKTVWPRQARLRWVAARLCFAKTFFFGATHLPNKKSCPPSVLFVRLRLPHHGTRPCARSALPCH